MSIRISTNTIFEKGVARMGELQTSLARTQQQVSMGRKILSPSDDPVASARALEVTNSQEINAKYATNRRTAKDALEASEGALQGVTSLLQGVKTLIVQAGSGVLDATQRKYIATELKGRFDELMGLANTRDALGEYIFAGYQTTTMPFTETPTGASYAGDQGVLQLQVFSARQISVSQDGNKVFESIKSNGLFTSSSVTGAATISRPVVTDATLLTGHTYNVVFANGGTTYDVIDTSTSPATTVLDDQAYNAAGTPVSVDGMQFDLSGAANDGDTFTIRPSGNQSIFTTFKDLIGALEAPATTDVQKRNFAHALRTANANVDSALDNVLTTRANVGASMKEVESLDSLGEDLHVQYATTLSNLQDLDYVQAITDLTKQQVSLQAAQQSFVKLSNMSLFNFLS
ncbi:MAG TPA: flagellar hook-associated protein FlgL [Noviherbaspirillum sp.]|uniref:flagellar hook-associated protein FlgL n=1 Tax=Noviherbaspirillum sp. TaxID=1926288 RepID=UPI002D29ED52|nr:flagellar hook-associated protein FlgL [Noviherbaspirillum sp.]HYD95690.1 flagellar hook-associated protein FlgL [Noviherbaspirillum sp.]